MPGEIAPSCQIAKSLIVSLVMAETFIHPKAIVEPGAVLGKGTRVWAFAHIMKGAVVGEDCNICDYAFIENGARLGNRVTVKNSVQIWEGVEVADDVFLGPGCIFTNDLRPRSGRKPPKELWLKKTRLEKGCTIGAGAILICGVNIGPYALVGAGSVVTRSVENHAMVFGVPARRMGWVCRCGARVEESGQESCSSCWVGTDRC